MRNFTYDEHGPSALKESKKLGSLARVRDFTGPLTDNLSGGGGNNAGLDSRRIAMCRWSVSRGGETSVTR